jgi:hypothetical protein
MFVPKWLHWRLMVCQASNECCEQETRQGSPYMSWSQMKLDMLLIYLANV